MQIIVIKPQSVENSFFPTLYYILHALRIAQNTRHCHNHLCWSAVRYLDQNLEDWRKIFESGCEAFYIKIASLTQRTGPHIGFLLFILEIVKKKIYFFYFFSLDEIPVCKCYVFLDL